MFQLNRNTGMIKMRHGAQNGRYDLKFRVYDRKHNQADVQANVTVTIREISHSTVTNSGSLRIAGITDEDFIRVWDDRMQNLMISKSDRLCEKIAELLNTERDKVEIFSVQLYSRYPPVTDVRFAVHGSSKYKTLMLNGIMLIHRDEIEKHVGINITMIGIDECLYENSNCEGSCTNVQNISHVPHLVNANRTALVGVHVHTIPLCTCVARDFTKREDCDNILCFNGGRCIETKYGPKCSCSSVYTGPRCQQTIRSFQGNGWAWYHPLEVCNNSHLSLEFVTKAKAGLLLYNGPVAPPDINEPIISDFISLELLEGKPRLLVDFGSGTLELKIEVKQPLNDGNWHHIDIFWDTEDVRLVLDYCIYADIIEVEDGGQFSFDVSSCEAKGIVPPFNEYLNVNTPLQIGGWYIQSFDPMMYNWKKSPAGKGFIGCIRHLYYNSQLLDLGSPALFQGSKSTCHLSRNDFSCGSSRSDNPCTTQTLPTSFAPGSYVKYALSFEPNSFTTDLQLRFRTREESGELFRVGDQHGREYAVLEIKRSRLHFYFNLNSQQTEERHLWLNYITVNDGQWHTAKVARYGSAAILKLDGGEGRRYNESFIFKGHQLLMVDKQEGVYAGGKAEYTGVRTFEVYNDYQKGCMDDIQFEGKQLPLPPAVNGTQWGQATMARNLGRNCLSNGPCISVLCPEPFVCVDLWNDYECACGEGRTLSSDKKGCIDQNECLNLPCLNGGTCINEEPELRYSCICAKNYAGENCELLQEELTLKLSVDALVAFLVCLLIIFILVFVFVAYNNRHVEPVKNPEHGEDVRENVISYDDEGGGEDDMTAFDIKPLQVPVEKSNSNVPVELSEQSKDPADVTISCNPDFKVINDTIDESVLPFDDIRNYAYEGSNSTAGSLSSLASGTEESDQEFDFLSNWGPKFHKLVYMYKYKQTGSEEEEDSHDVVADHHCGSQHSIPSCS